MLDKVHILIVEDSVTQATEIKYFLQKSGYNVSVCKDGEEAWHFMQKQETPPSLVISDIVMPKMNGYELCEKIRRDEKFNNVMVMLLTALSEPTDIIMGLKCQADSYLIKPYNKNFLLSHIGNLLEYQNFIKEMPTDMGLAIDFFGQRHFLTNNRIQIINNLLSVHSTVETQSNELKRALEAEKKLKDSEDRFRQLHEASFGGIGIHDKGIILECNRGLSELTGFAYDELIGMDGLQLIAPEWREHVMKNILSGYEKPYEVEGLRKDGSRYPLEIQGKVVPYKGRKARVTEFRDISERKLALEALQKSEKRYRLLADNITDNIWVFDLVTMRFSYTSPSSINILGYTEKEAMGLQLQDILTPASLEFAINLLNEELSEASQNPDPLKSRTLELEQYHKNGSIVWTEVSVRFIYDQEKRPTSLLGVTRKITERKKMEEALRRSEQNYRELFEKGSDLLCVHDLKGNLIQTNLSFKKAYGWEQDELLKMNLQDLIPERYRDQFKDYLKRIVEKGRDEGFMRVLTKEGKEIIIEYNNILIFDETGPIGVHGSGRDITDRLKNEWALRNSEEKYRSFVENFQGIAYKATLETWVPIFFHGAVEKISGYTEQEFLAGSPYWHQLILPDDLKSLPGKDEIRCVPNYSVDRKYRIIRKDGNVRWVHEMSRNVCDESGKPVEIEGTITDITLHKQTEEENIKLENKLRHAEKMEAMGTLAGGVAHDLNNVLSGIVGYPELLLMQLPKDSPLRKPISAIHESGLKASAIVNDLLTLARRGIVDYEVLNLNAVISQYLGSPEYEKMKSFHPGVEVETNLEAGLLNISGSPVHMLKVIMNLVSNSAEAIGDKGKICITTTNRYVDIPISGYENVKEGNYVTLTVSDTGKGINPDDMKKIFEPFYTKKKMGKSGTGLGLAVVWGTVKDHKGYIDVNSIEGNGTAFTIYFPVTREELARNKNNFSIESYMGKGQAILIVDDVKEQRELLSSILMMLGYSVNTVSSGEEAVEYLQSNSADLVILDMIMAPGIDGLDTYKQILKLHPHQKAIIASGYSETNRVKEAQRLGAERFIKKPYTFEKIGVAVKEELEKQ